MPPDNEVSIRHMVDAIETGLRFVEAKERSELDHD